MDLMQIQGMSTVCAYFTFNSAYNEKNADTFLRYKWLFAKGDAIIGEWEIFGVEVFLRYS